jgi:hypothetical protein
MTDLEAGLAELATALDALQIGYALIGGLALSLWGEPRATLDIDVTVWVPLESWEAAVEALCRRLAAVPAAPQEFVRATHVLPLLTSAGVRADVVFGELPAERDVVDRAVVKEAAGVKVAVASVEDLIVMKLISERERDSEDARRLLRRFRSTIDRGYLKEKLEGVAEGLGRPEILRNLEEALGG